jgi:type I restriction enzyme S subunit
LVRTGDRIVSTVRTYLRAVWPIRDAAEDLVVSTGFAVLSPGDCIEPRYLGWLVQSDLVIEEVVARSVGVSYPAINASEIGELRVPVPAVPQQRAIADYLDVETARIDQMVDLVRRQREQLGARRRAAVSMAIAATPGPKVQLRRLVTSITSGPRGWAEYEVDTGGAAFLRITNVPRDSVTLDTAAVARVDPPVGEEADRCQTHAGDVVVTITAAIGQVAVVPPQMAGAYVSQHLALVRPNRLLVTPEWLALSIWSDEGQTQLDLARYGGTKQQLSLDDVREVRLVLPPLEAQSRVAAELHLELEKLEQVAACRALQMDLLIERRKGLITGAVTGRLRLPGVAA